MPLAAALGVLRAALDEVDRVVFAPSADTDGFDTRSAHELFNQARSLVAELISMPTPPRLFIVTRNAQPVAEGDRANPAHAVLWGLGRTLALETPEIWGAMIDLDESMPAVLTARRVVDEAVSGDGEDQVVYRAGHRFVPRLQPIAATALDTTLDKDASQLVIGATGHIGPI